MIDELTVRQAQESIGAVSGPADADELAQAVEVLRTAVADTSARSPSQRCEWLQSLALGLYQCFLLHRESSFLDEAISVGQQALAIDDVGDVRIAVSLNLANALRDRFTVSGNNADLDGAVEAGAIALRLAESDQSLWTDVAATLAWIMFLRHNATSDRSDLDRAIALGEQAVRLQGGLAVNQAVNLCAWYRLRFGLAGELGDLRAAVAHGRWAAPQIGNDTTAEVANAVNLAVALELLLEFDDRDEILNEAIDRLGILVRTRAGVQEGWSLFCRLFVLRFHRSGDPADLDQAIAAGQVRMQIPSSPTETMRLLGLLGELTWDRFKLSRMFADITASVAYFRSALQAARAADSVAEVQLSGLGGALLDLTEAGGGPDEVAEAISIWRTLLDLPAADGETSELRKINYAVALTRRYDRIAQESDLREALELVAEVVAATTDPQVRASRLLLLGITQLRRYRATSNQADLDDAVVSLRRARERLPSGRQSWVEATVSLGQSLAYRYELASRPEDLNTAIDCFVAAVPYDEMLGPGDRAHRVNLSVLLRERFTKTRDRPDIDNAIDVARTQVDNSGDAAARTALIRALRKRFDVYRALNDLDEALQLQREVLDASDVPGERYGAIWDLVPMLISSYRAEPRPTAAEEAIHLAEEAVRLATMLDQSPWHASALLAAALVVGFDATRARERLDEAVTLLGAAVEADVDDDERSAWLDDLSNVLMRRFQSFHDEADLDRSVEVARRCLASAPDDSHRSKGYDAMCRALVERAEHRGSIDDINDAIRNANRAVTLAGDGPLERALPLGNLATAHLARYELISNLHDLNRCIDYCTELVGLETPGIWRGRFLGTLCYGLRLRFERERIENNNADDIERAIVAGREALTVTPVGDPDRYKIATNLGTALRVRFESSGARSDGDEAIEYARSALDGAPDGASIRSAMANNLCLALVVRVQKGFGGTAELDEAVNVGLISVETSLATPYEARRRHNLAIALLERYKRSGAERDLDEALLNWNRAALAAQCPISARARAAFAASQTTVQWRGQMAAVAAYRTAIDLVPLLAWRGIAGDDQRHLLGNQMPSIAVDAAACFFAAGLTAESLRALELGRGVLWSQMLNLRTDLDVLESQYPEIAQKMRQCRNGLDALAG